MTNLLTFNEDANSERVSGHVPETWRLYPSETFRTAYVAIGEGAEGWIVGTTDEGKILMVFDDTGRVVEVDEKAVGYLQF